MHLYAYIFNLFCYVFLFVFHSLSLSCFRVFMLCTLFVLFFMLFIMYNSLSLARAIFMCFILFVLFFGFHSSVQEALS
jgi:hypothetical protein